MAQWVKALAAKPGDLSSNPKTHMVKGENSSKSSSDLHIYTDIRTKYEPNF